MGSRRTLLAVLAGLAAIAAWIVRSRSEQPYFDMVARMRAAGEAVDYDDLRGKDVPPEENGAADLVAAFDWLGRNMPPETAWTAPGWG